MGQLAAGHEHHAIQFYADDAELSGSVIRYLGEGLSAGGSALVVATEAHRSQFRAGLAAAGVHSGAGYPDRLIMVDAAGLLSGFMAGDQLDHARFQQVAEDLLKQAASAGRPVRIYGEMVALLWDAGKVTLALELESMWNDLASRYSFSLLCGYPERIAAPGGEASAAVEEVCRLHTDVIASRPDLAGAAQASDGNEAVRSFPRARDSARAAREFVTGQLDSWVGDAVAVDAAIVIAELASNAVLHAQTLFTVTVSWWADRVRIAVRDAAPLPDAVDDRLVTKPGHGLDLVGKVARKWAVEPLADGKVIWAELLVPAREGPG